TGGGHKPHVPAAAHENNPPAITTTPHDGSLMPKEYTAVAARTTRACGAAAGAAAGSRPAAQAEREAHTASQLVARGRGQEGGGGALVFDLVEGRGALAGGSEGAGEVEVLDLGLGGVGALGDCQGDRASGAVELVAHLAEAA